MAKHSIKLINEIASLNDSKRYSDCTGFIVKFESKKFIVSVHNFLPLISTYLNIDSEKIKLNKIKDIYWNEINIFEIPDSKFFLNTKIIYLIIYLHRILINILRIPGLILILLNVKKN